MRGDMISDWKRVEFSMPEGQKQFLEAVQYFLDRPRIAAEEVRARIREFTTDAVDGSIQNVRTAGPRTTVTVRQDGQMPSPVVLAVHFALQGPALRPMANAQMVDDSTALVTWPVDVWFGGSRTFDAVLNFGARRIERIVFDPHCRFPDHDASDNTWPRQPSALSRQPSADARGPGGVHPRTRHCLVQDQIVYRKKRAVAGIHHGGHKGAIASVPCTEGAFADAV